MEHIFTLWPSIADLAKDLGKPYPTVAAWHQRKSIPGRYDLELLECARKRGINLTLEEIARYRAASQEKTGAA